MNTSTLVYDYSIFIRSESALILFTNFELALFVPRLKTIYILWDILIHKFKCAFQNNHSFIEENFKPQWFHVNPFRNKRLPLYLWDFLRWPHKQIFNLSLKRI